MLPTKQNQETLDVELLAIVQGLKPRCHYLKRAAYSICVLTNHNNLKKSI